MKILRSESTHWNVSNKNIKYLESLDQCPQNGFGARHHLQVHCKKSV